MKSTIPSKIQQSVGNIQCKLYDFQLVYVHICSITQSNEGTTEDEYKQLSTSICTYMQDNTV